MSRFGWPNDTLNDFLLLEPLQDYQKNVYNSRPLRADLATWSGMYGYVPSKTLAGDLTTGDGEILGADGSNSLGWFEFPISRSLTTSYAFSGFFLNGVTRDNAGAILANCTIHGYWSVDDTYQGETTSNFAGEYCWVGQYQQAHYLVAYKAGSPDVAGTTVDTLVPTTARTS